MEILDSLPVIGSRRKIKEAERIVRNANWDFEDAQEKLKQAQDTSKTIVSELADLKITCAQQTIPNAADVLSRCQRINLKETKASQTFSQKFDKVTVPQINEVKTTLSEVVNTGIKGTSAGAALALGSMGLVSTFGAASTGTSIATLSGVAAKNATIAWFGGGALSAGGAGMAGGAIALGGIALAPLAVFGAFKYSKHAEKQMSEAIEFSDKVEAEIENINATIRIAEALNSHVTLFHNTISKVQNYVESLTHQLACELDQDPRNNKKIILLKQQVILFVKALKKLVSVSLFQDDKPSNESLKMIEHINNVSDDNVGKLLNRVNNNENIKPQNKAKYLQDIPPGTDSPTYFWLQDIYPESPSNSPKIWQGYLKDFLQMLVGTSIFATITYFLSEIGWLSLSFITACLTALRPLLWIKNLFKNKIVSFLVGLVSLAIVIFFSLAFIGSL